MLFFIPPFLSTQIELGLVCLSNIRIIKILPAFSLIRIHAQFYQATRCVCVLCAISVASIARVAENAGSPLTRACDGEKRENSDNNLISAPLKPTAEHASR
jgi:hypothetical protein